MDFLFTLASFLIAITLLVFIHEYGHFKVARLCGIKVKRFSIGFGKPFYTKVDKHGTEWAVAPFPLGGYISMVDTRVEAPAAGEESMAFDKKSLWKRSAVVLAGPLANLLFAWVAWTILLSGSSEELGPYLGAVTAQSPAAKAGFQDDDRIASVDGVATRSLAEIHMAMMRDAMDGKDARVVVARDGKSIPMELPLSSIDSAAMASGEGFRTLGFGNPAGARIPARIKTLLAGGPGEKAGLRAGETVAAIDGRPIATWSAMGAVVNSSADKELTFTMRDDKGASREVRITPKIPAGAKDGIAKVGAALDATGMSEAVRKQAYATIARGPLEAMEESASRCARFTKMTFDALTSMFAGKSSSDNISGPVGIAKQAGDAAESGPSGYGNFLAFLSLSLFFMNLIPLPGLDGGHLAMFAAEAAIGKPLSERAQAAAAKFGFSVLGALMIFALYNDLSKLFK